MSRRFLLITYYWPPAGGIAVQRWVKITKYLARQGWTPVIYTVQNGHYPQLDESMVKDVAANAEVIKRPILEPHGIYQRFAPKRGSNTDEISQKKKSFVGRFSTWIRSNFFIPDARSLWVSPSVRYLKQYLRQHPVDAIISTGPPHSVHLIAMKLKQVLSIPWLADFRDPWTTMDYYHDLLLTRWADKKHHLLEKEVLTTADAVTVVGHRMKEEFGPKRGGVVHVLPNGFDEEDFAGEVTLDDRFTLMYVGSFFGRINPTNLWRVLGQLKKENHPLMQKLCIRIMGHVAPPVLQSLEENELMSYLEVIPFQPHAIATREMKRAAVLLMGVDVRTKFVLTGKLFEYLGAGRPILGFGPTDGDAARIVEETGAGKFFSFEEEANLRAELINWFDQFIGSKLNLDPKGTAVYAHRTLASNVNTILTELAGTP